MEVREAVIADNEELLSLQAQCPMGRTLIVSVVNAPDFFARLKAYESCKVFVACDGGRIIGSAACAVRDAVVAGQVRRVGYEFQAFTSLDYRRRGVASRLHKAREEYLRRQGAVLSYAVILEGNVPAMRYIEGHGFSRHRAVLMPVMWVYKEVDVPSAGKIRPATTEDLPALADLVNETWQGHDLYGPTSAEALARFVSRTPAYGLDNLFVLEDGREILACLGYWDWTQIMRTVVKRLSFKLHLVRLLVGLAACFRPMPRAPRAGARLAQWCLTPVGFRDGAHLAALFRYVNNRARQRDVDQMFCVCEHKHPMLTSMKGLFRTDVGLSLYVKPLADVSLGDGPVFVDAIDL
jgi:GNAT superfamily N-acetyltransferase